MTIKTGTGCTLAIGTVLAAPNGLQAEYEADSYTNVGTIEELGEFGDQRSSVTFAPLDVGRMLKARGIADAGDMTVIYAHSTADSGQDAIKTAYEAVSQSLDEFNFRIQLNDSLGSNPTTFYFRAKIMTRRVQSISNDAVVKVQAVLGINSGVLEVAAS